MSKFINVTIQAKSIGSQAYHPKTIGVNSDAILSVKPTIDNKHDIIFKPEYDKRIRQAAGLDERNELQYIHADSKDIKSLFE